MIALQSANSFGIDGRSLWMNAVAMGSERGLSTDLAGRHLAGAMVAAPLLALIAVGRRAVRRPPGAIVPAAAHRPGAPRGRLRRRRADQRVLPYTMPERMNAFSGAAPGQGGQAFAWVWARCSASASCRCRSCCRCSSA